MAQGYASASPNGVILSGIREVLTANRIYYVRLDGNDSNNGSANDSAHAFLTIQKAVDVTLKTLDFSGFNVTIQVAAGTYTTSTAISDFNQNGVLTIQGDATTPANVVLNTSGNCFDVRYSKGRVYVTGFDMRSSGGNCIYNISSWVTFGKVIFGAAPTGGHVWTVYGGSTWNNENYTINGSTPFHVVSQFNAFVQIAPTTVTLTGTPAFTNSFLNCYHLAYFLSTGTSWSGAATGTRYTVGMNAGAYVGGAGVNYLPGNLAGATGNGGQYA